MSLSLRYLSRVALTSELPVKANLLDQVYIQKFFDYAAVHRVTVPTTLQAITLPRASSFAHVVKQSTLC
jgi:hypothetical protein